MTKLYCLFLMVFSTGAAISQCLIQKIPLTERLQTADVVVEGKVVHQYSFDDRTSGRIYTANEVEVTRIFKGTAKATITVFTLGGVLGDRMDIISPSLQFAKGEAGVFILHNTSWMAYSYCEKPLPFAEIGGHFGVSGPSSFIKYDLLSKKAIDITETFQTVDILRKDLEEINQQKAQVTGSVQFYQPSANKKRTVTSFSPTVTSGGTGSVLTISGSGFGSVRGSVGFADANDGGSSTYIVSDKVYFESWSNTEIKIYVPTRAGTGQVSVITASNTTFTSTTDLTVEYTRLELAAKGPTANPDSSLYRPSLDDDNGNGGLTWVMNDDFKKNSRASKTLMRALQNWRCSTGVNFNIDTINTTTTNTIGRDGVHTIMWQNPNQSISPGALAITSSQWSGCYNSSTQNWHWYLNDVDMVFDDVLSNGRTWNYGPDGPTSQEYDMESVALHELGHAHQLSHIINSDGTMHYSIRNGASKRTLDTDSDIKGGDAVMATSTVSTGCSSVDPMVKLTANCKLIDVVDIVAEYEASKLKICAGDTITFTNKSTPADNNVTWRLPASAQIVSRTTGDQILEVAFPTAGSFVIGVVLENKGFLDSLYKNINVNATPTVLGRKITDVSCNGANDGEISILFGDGKAPFTVTLVSDNSTGNPIQNLAPAMHVFTIEDNNGCTNIDSNAITEPTVLEVVGTGKEDTWSGVNRGKAWVEATGGTAPYSYSWNDADNQKQDTARNLASGNYTVTITDDNDCETTAEVEITESVGLPEYLRPALYPNPVQHVVFITNVGSSFAQVQVLDMSGRVLQTEKLSNNHQLDVSQLSKGTYLLQFSGTAGTYQELIIKE